MLWCDKYRPHTLDKFLLHKQEADNLKKLATTGDCPHLLFYGQPGVGKKTFILAMLREMFGPGVEKLRVENRAWKIEVPGRETKVEVELTTVASNHHIELNPADAGFKDRYVISEVVKEMAKNRPLDVMGNKGFKVVVLNEVDRISKQAQHSLRRTMEKYSAGCRIILCCNNVSKVIEAIRSRCLCVRVAAPSNEEVIEILHTVSRRENLTLPQPLAERIAKYSDRNVRKALLCLETIKTHSYPFAENQVVQATDWEMFVGKIANDIVAEQTPKRLYEIRQSLYELIVNCIPSDIILKQLVLELSRKLDQTLKPELMRLAAEYEHRLQLGTKDIFHLEAFVAKFMALYKDFLVSMFG